jgi:hypothetical protein
MNEQELRSLVREAIERHLGRPDERRGRLPVSPNPVDRRPPFLPGHTPHASHILLKVVPGSEVDDGMCVIEPSVRCNHCGFCQSYGH